MGNLTLSSKEDFNIEEMEPPTVVERNEEGNKEGGKEVAHQQATEQNRENKEMQVALETIHRGTDRT